MRECRRRDFLLSSAALLVAPLAGAQTATTPPVFGILLAFSREAGLTFTRPLRAYMEALGYVDGRTVIFDIRYADGKVERLPALAAALAAQHPAVIATFGDAAGLAAQAATSSIPIVAMSEDLVGAKLVDNMARPGRNITGVSILGTELDKRNFRKKILSMDLLVETDEVEQGVRHRAARLYRFDRRKYDRLTKQGFELSI